MNTTTQRSFHQKLAQATRKRRQAAGRYDKPTKAQQEACQRSMLPGATFSMSENDLLLMSQHPWLAGEQRQSYLKRYEAAIAAE